MNTERIRSIVLLSIICLLLLLIGYAPKVEAVDSGIQGFRLPFSGTGYEISQGPRCECNNQSVCSHNSIGGPKNVEALDISMTIGTNVYAAQGGTVHFDSSENGEMHIDHANGYTSVYAHMSERLHDGQTVNINDKIGESGDAGAPGKPHLHFSIVKDNMTVAIPIYDMPGLLWKSELAPYPAQGGCVYNGLNDGTAQWPPPSCGQWSPGEGSDFRQSDFLEAYNSSGGQIGIGCSENPAHEQGGVWLQNFSGGSVGPGCAIIYNPFQSTAHAVCNPFIGAYFNTPDWWDTLGPATTEKIPAGASSNTNGFLVGFDEGDIYNANDNPNAYVVKGRFMDVYKSIGGSSSTTCGWPIDGEVTAWPSPQSTGRGQRFEYCTMYLKDPWLIPYVVQDPIENAFDQVGGTPTVGFPVGYQGTAAQSPQGTNGVWQPFEEGNMYYSPTHGAFAVIGGFYEYHEYALSPGGTASELGFPTSNQYIWYGFQKQNFEGAELVCHPYAQSAYDCFVVALGTTEPDVTPPETNFVQTPAVCNSGNQIVFEYTGSDNSTPTENLTYATQVDTGSWSDFSGEVSKVLNNLSQGSHTFRVKARDDWGNLDESPAEFAFETDTTAPETSAVVLAGTSGQNGWYTSLVDLQLNRTDSGCGSSNIQTWISFNGGPEELYDGGPLTFDQEGIHTLEVYSVDAAGNQESVKTFEIKIDWTPPMVSGNATGPRDTNGVFRGDVTIDGIATDNLSGVGLEEMSLDGGTNWQSMSQTVLTGSGTGRILYRATDIAGNVSTVLDSGQVIINQYVVFANQPVESLLVDGTSNILIEGDMHTNGSAWFKYNTGSTVNGTVSAVSTITTSQGNTNLSLGGIQQNAPSVPMLSYPMSLYQSLCDVHVTGDLVVDSVAQNIEGVYCVSGNLSLRSVLLSGPVTFVVNGNITDDMVGSDLQTTDPYNGVMMIAGGNILLRGNGYDLLGLIYAPNGTITLKNNDVRINGSFVAQNVVFDGTGSGFELRYNAAFSSGTFPLPLSESSFWDPSENGTIPTPAPTAQPTATPQPTTTPTATPAPTVQPTATPVPTVTSGGTLYVSTDGDEVVGSVAWDEEDIVTHNPSSETWAMLFDGSDVNAENIDALHILSDGSVLVSFDYSVTLPGLSGTVSKEDIVKFTPTQSGNTTTGTWSWYFDGSDVSLSSTKNVDGLHVLTNGKLVVSFSSGFTLSGPGSIQDEDLVVFTPTQLGATTAGSWAWYFDGSDVELDENIDGVWVADSGDIYLTTSSSWDEVSIDADDEDIFVCVNPTIGSNSTCTFGSSVYWDGSAHGMSGDVDAFHIAP